MYTSLHHVIKQVNMDTISGVPWGYQQVTIALTHNWLQTQAPLKQVHGGVSWYTLMQDFGYEFIRSYIPPL